MVMQWDVAEDVFDIMYEPLAGANTTTLLRLLAQNHFRVAGRYLPRLLYAGLISTILAPFRLLDTIRYRSTVADTEITIPPLFIIGHWRSGTTYLHNLFSIDEQFGYCSTFHSLVPGAFLGNPALKSIVAASIPETRPMDEVPMGADLPQEEEYALGSLTPYAYYNGWIFPRQMRYYNQTVCLDEAPQRMQELWRRTYRGFLQKLTYHWEGTAQILKNPANTARLPLLLDMFPRARYVHIKRNPYDVYASMMKFMTRVLPRYTVQRPPPQEQMTEAILDVYEALYRNYITHRAGIPDGHLIEVSYEAFVQEPLVHLERIYDVLSLDGFPAYKERFASYVASQSHIKARHYELDSEHKERVAQRWAFAFDELGYEP